MSGIFLKSEFKDLFNNNTTETITISNVLNKYMKNTNEQSNIPLKNDYIATTTVNYDGSETSSMINNGTDMNFSATSPMINDGAAELSATSTMVGGEYDNFSATSTMAQSNNVATNNQSGGNNDIDSLVGMLTSESTANEELLETKLKSMLNNKVGGGHNNGDELTNVKQFFSKLKNNGVKVDLKLDDLTLTEFFNNKSSKNLSGGGVRHLSNKQTHSKVESEVKQFREGDDDELHSQNGGRDLPPALVAFQKIRSLVAKELELKGIKVSAKVASALKKDVAKDHPNASPMDLADIAVKYFKENKSKYEKLAKSLA
jgi:hypothetical protein